MKTTLPTSIKAALLVCTLFCANTALSDTTDSGDLNSAQNHEILQAKSDIKKERIGRYTRVKHIHKLPKYKKYKYKKPKPTPHNVPEINAAQSALALCLLFCLVLVGRERKSANSS